MMPDRLYLEWLAALQMASYTLQMNRALQSDLSIASQYQPNLTKSAERAMRIVTKLPCKNTVNSTDV